MPILARGESNSTTNPKLTWYGITAQANNFQAGLLLDPVSVDFEVFDVSTEEKATVPVEVIARTALNLVTDKVGTGRFVPPFTLPADAALGRHEIRFYYVLEAGDAERAERCEFEVVKNVSAFQAGPLYCSPSDLKEEGVCNKTDAFLLRRINMASRDIERFTGRRFVPEYKEVNVDGRGDRKILFEEPIVGIESVAFETTPFLPSAQDIDPQLLRVYARHLSQGLFRPDDRNNPKVELFAFSDAIRQARPFRVDRLLFPMGQQNVVVKGVFGYTDPGGLSCGQTPEGIRVACMLMVMRTLSRFGDTGKRDDDMKRSRIIQERTRDQTYRLQPLGTGAGSFSRPTGYTGDPEIDVILQSFTRPIVLGAA